MTDNKSDSSDMSLDVSDVNRRLNSVEMSDPLPAFHERRNMASEGSGSGRCTPLRARTMKEYDQQIASLQKENFNLKLRIYFLEEDARKKFGGSKDEIYQLNIELKVELESLRNELQEKNSLLKKASSALDTLSANCNAEIRTTRERLEVGSRMEVNHLKEELEALRGLLKTRDEEAKKVKEDLEKATERILELVQINERMVEEDKKPKEDAEVDKSHPDLIDFSFYEKETSVLEEQLGECKDELEKKNKLIEQLRCALKVKDVLIEQAESEKNEVESKFKEVSRASDEEELGGAIRAIEHSSDEDPAEREARRRTRTKVVAAVAKEADGEKLLLESFVEKLSDRVKDREDEIKDYRKAIRNLEGKCMTLMQIIEEMKAQRGEGDGMIDEGTKSSWSRLYRAEEEEDDDDMREDEGEAEESERDMDSNDFNNISHLQWKNVGQLGFGEHSLDSSRQSSANVEGSKSSVVGGLRRLEKENADLKDRLWAMEQQFHDWKHDEKEAHVARTKNLKDDLERALEAKDALEEQCSELEQELFRMKRYFNDLGSFVVDFDAQEIGGDEASASSSQEFVDKLCEVYARQERLLKEREEAVSMLEAEIAEHKEARKRTEEEVGRLKMVMRDLEEKTKSLDGEDALRMEMEELKQNLSEKEREMAVSEQRFKSERDSLLSRCKEVEAINLQLNGRLIEAKQATEALSKKLATSDALGQQLNTLLKEGGEITRQLNVKAEQLALDKEDLSLKLEQKARDMEALEGEIRRLREMVSERELTVENVQRELVAGKNLEAEMKKELASRKELVSSCRQKISRQESLIEELNRKLNSMCTDLKTVNQASANTQGAASSPSGLPRLLEGSPSAELEKISRKKEQLLSLMSRKRASAGRPSEKDDLISQWCELVSTIEREWRRELKDIKRLEEEWHTMLVENRALQAARISLEREVGHRDAVIKDLRSAAGRPGQESGAVPACANAIRREPGLRQQQEQPPEQKFFALETFYSTDSMDASVNSTRGGAGEEPNPDGSRGLERSLATPESLQAKLARTQRELAAAREAIESLQEHIRVNDNSSQFNPALIMHLVAKIRALKDELLEARATNPPVEADELGPSGRTASVVEGESFGRPATLNHMHLGGSETESCQPSIETGKDSEGLCLRNVKMLEDLQRVVRVLKRNIRAKLSTSARPSFGRLSELVPRSTDVAFNGSLRELDFSRASAASDFDSTHLDESAILLCENELALSDMLAESEARCQLMKARLKELVRFLKSLLGSQGGMDALETEEDLRLRDYLDETTGLLENVDQWVKEHENIMGTSICVEENLGELNHSNLLQGNYQRLSSVGQPSLLQDWHSLEPNREESTAEGGDLASAEGIFRVSELLAPPPRTKSPSTNDEESPGALGSRVSVYVERCEKLSERLIDVEQMKEQLERELSRMKEEKEQGGVELAELRSKVNELEQIILTKEEEMRDLKECLEEAQRVQGTNAEELKILREQAKATQKEIEGLRFEKGVLTEAVLHSETVIPDLRRRLDESNGNVDTLTGELQRARCAESRLADTEESLQEAEAKLKEKAMQIFHLEERIRDLYSELEEERDKSSNLEVEVEKMQFDLTVSRNRADRNSAKLKETKEEILKLEVKCQALASDVEQQQSQRRSLEGELEEKLERLNDGERRVVELRSRLEDLQHSHEVLNLERESLERRLSEERLAVRSALSGGAIAIAQGPPRLDKSTSINLSPEQLKSEGLLWTERDDLQFGGFEADSSIACHSLAQSSRKETLDCWDCIRLREELVLMREERDSLNRKVLELSSKDSLLTSEVISRPSGGEGEVGLSSCCLKTIKEKDRCINDLRSILEMSEKVIPKVALEIQKINAGIKNKKLSLVELDSKFRELENSLREASTDMRNACGLSDERIIISKATLEEHQRLVKTLKVEVNMLRMKVASYSGPDSKVASPAGRDANENKENLKLDTSPSHDTPQRGVEDSDPLTQVTAVREELEREIEVSSALRKQLAALSSGSGDGTKCDHSGFVREIMKLRRKLGEHNPPPPRGTQAQSGRDSASINKSEIIQEINKTRKVLAMTCSNMAQMKKGNDPKRGE